jgi:hypothetical protein
MELKQLKIFPFHTFILPVFFVWHICNDYFGLFPFNHIAKFVAGYMGLAVVLFFTGWLIFRDKIKAGCWATFSLVVFFFWGAFHDLLISLKLSSFFISYKFWLACIFLLIIALTWRLRRKTPVKANQFLNLLFGLFLIAELVVSAYKFISGQHLKNDLYSGNKMIPGSFKRPPTDPLPDIFFIIFDEYASSSSLKKYLQFDNSVTDSLLTKKGFYIAASSKSNYNSTPHSIASTLNFDYLDNVSEQFKTEPKELLKAEYTIKKSLLPHLLQKAGYTIYNYGIGDLDGYPYKETPIFDHAIADALYNETLWARIEKAFGWRMPSWLLTANPKKIESHYNKDVKTIHEHITATLDELNKQGPVPKFVFIHVRIPHDPYYFDSAGKRRNILVSDDRPNIRDSLYKGQLTYTNQWLHKIINNSDREFARPRVVIIEGDHGRRDDPQTVPYIYEKQFMNLSTYYFSDKNYSMLYDSISPVNSFRVVLNKYFSAGLPLLKDSTILLH